MPIYEYVCLDCKTKFDALRSIKEADAPIACKECNSEHTSRMLSLFFAHSDGRVVAQQSSAAACSSCAGGHCATCG
jgi:putative FmdB family regulatory protein